MPKFSITTLGCKVNQAESEAIAQDLLSSDWSTAADCDKAEVCIINTCTVTQKASMQSRQAIRKAIRSNPKARVIVTGCYAQTAPQEINRIDGVDHVIGHDKKLSISRMTLSKSIETIDDRIPSFSDTRNSGRFQMMPTAISASRTRPFLKIQDGCNAFCTYCIVPYARGRSRSMPLENVLQSIQQLAEADFHEVVLTGIHLGAYGRDLTPAGNLAALLRHIRTLESVDRVRLSSIEPLELSPEIIQLVAESDMFCRHFHIPLQSGDDRILKKMGRPYSRQVFHDLIDRIQKVMPDAAIGADTLIGFPGENDKAFENTYNLIKELPVNYLHVFPFSVRPGTRAADFTGKVPPEIIKDRCERMRKMGLAKRKNFYRKFVGKTMPLLIETKRDNATGFLKGISSNYLPVLIEGKDEFKNKIIEVQIEKMERGSLFGSHAV
jgi:threonylcarbamoyladenosine tRNA methylthiotransferase MtaB